MKSVKRGGKVGGTEVSLVIALVIRRIITASPHSSRCRRQAPGLPDSPQIRSSELAASSVAANFPWK